jgi:hypothetical protein
MDNLRFGNSVRKVTMLQPGPSGTLTPTVLYDDRNKKKKQTRGLRPLERAQRRFVQAQRVYWDTIVKRHKRSNAKKRDGWARDAIGNIVRASEKSSKQLSKAF